MRGSILIVAAALLAPLAAPAAGSPAGGAEGSFTCDFVVDGSMPIESVGPTIERDRMFMAERPGMLHKHIPFRPDPAAEGFQSGGRYLFETHDHAVDYLRWVREEFVLDGVPFLERPEFRDVDCHAWSVIGSAQLSPLRAPQVTLRTEQWSVPEDNQRPYLKERWPALLDEAQERGLGAVWLLYQRQEDLVQVVAFQDRTAAASPLSPDPGLATLEAAPSLGEPIVAEGWEKRRDLTHWTLTVWFPYAFADGGEAALWPQSPPFPQPTTSDGVCVPSRGETHESAPDDCLPTCGDGRADEGEDRWGCPSDVRELG